MLAIIIGLLSFFLPGDLKIGHAQYHFADSIKRPGKNRIVDTTGRFVEVNRIFIIGNRVTRDQIISRELTLKQGDIVYTSDLPGILDLDRKKLLNTRLFTKVEIRTLDLDSRKIDLLVDLKERWYTFPSPVFELSDRNFNEWWQNYNHDPKRINYGLRLYQYNMRGRNETLRLLAQFGFQRRFELLYRFPYIDRKQKHGLQFDLGYLETKNLAIRTVEHKYEFLKSRDILRSDKFLGVTYSYRKSFYQTHTIKAEYRKIDINDTVKTLNPNYIHGEGNRSQQFGSLTYQFSADHRDLFSYPLNGYQLVASASKVGISPGDNVNKLEANLLYSQYLDLKKGFFLANNSVLYWSTPDNLSYVNYSALGLRKQFMHGYEIYIIEGPYFFMNKTTFKKRIFSRQYHWADMPPQFQHIPIAIYLKTYADFAYVANYSYYSSQGLNTTLSNKLLRGAGFGLDVVSSYDIVLRFEYSFNIKGEHGFFFNVKKEF
jgi:outer membrane protein assembly factor BamA